SLYDRKWALICADVDRPIGAAYSWSNTRDAAAYVGRGREQTLDCSDAGTPEGAGPGVVLRRCRDRASGLEWNSYAATSNDRTHIVEGLAAFDDALRLTLASLVEDREELGTLEIGTAGGDGSLTRAPASFAGHRLLTGECLC